MAASEEIKARVAEQVSVMLDGLKAEFGDILKAPTKVLSEYTVARGEHLARAYGQPGFGEAVVAERDAILLFACETAAVASERVRAQASVVIEYALRFLVAILPIVI